MQAKIIRKLNRLLKKVKSHKERMSRLSDEELALLTVSFRERLKKGEKLDALLPEAFAAMCEADYRVLGKFPYDVQILGGIALHKGYLAEMNTGEGKTLTATLPLYLNALTEKSSILVTTNDYLALRDSEEMGQVYRFMGLTCAAGVHKNPENRFTNEQKREIYSADIVYTTHSALGFDYLFHNLVTSAEERFLRDFYYVIIDEADAVLLDAAHTPLIISGAPRVQSNLYELADFFFTTLIPQVDYESENKRAWLTESGVHKAEHFFEIDHFYDPKNFEINRYVILALRAHLLFEKEKDYVVNDKGEIVLLDRESGRMKPGTKLRGGQHQALEMKEHLKITRENRSTASITYQSLFLLFPKMAGMSGTISDASEELLSVYGKQVLVIPPHCPVQRKDLPDLFFDKSPQQFLSAMELVLKTHRTGQPVLIVVSAIRETTLVSKILLEEDIAHNVLNANNAFWEADMISEAGQKNAVTVATSMAGRGTDIKLGEGVKELGGLAVIGIGRMANVRQERQARGRSGRQGDPGFSRFFVCLEDEVVQMNMSEELKLYETGEKKMTSRKRKHLINYAQVVGEESAVSLRRSALEYDRVAQKQRAVMYATRNLLLDGGTIEKEKLEEIARRNIERFLSGKRKIHESELNRYILDNISYWMDNRKWKKKYRDKQDAQGYLLWRVKDGLREQEYNLGEKKWMDEFVRRAALSAIDEAWVEQVDYLQQLQTVVKGRNLAQRNPVSEYQKEAYIAFSEMKNTILQNIMRNVLLGRATVDADGKLFLLLP